jgi:hypothetical protein
MPKLKEIIGEQAYNALPEDKKKEYDNVDLVNGAEHVAKKDYETAQATIKQQKKDIEKRDTDIETIQTKVKDNEELTKEIDTLKLTNKSDREGFEKQLNDIAFNNVLEKGLNAFNVKDKTLIMALLNKENLKADGDSIIGLKEQIEPLQKSHEYLFEKVINGTHSFNSGGGEHKDPQTTNFASELGKQKAEVLKAKGLSDFAK